MYRECFMCGTSEGRLIPAPGSSVDKDGIPLDVVCHRCYDEIGERLLYASGLRQLSGELTGEELYEMQGEYVALQQNM